MGCVLGKPQNGEKDKGNRNRPIENKVNGANSNSDDKKDQVISTYKAETQNNLMTHNFEEYEDNFVVKLDHKSLHQDKPLLQCYSQIINRGTISRIDKSERKEKPKSAIGSEKRFKELQNLALMIESNLEQSDLIQGKDIVIVLGATGVGKSTSINYLLGKKMIWSKIQNQTKSYVYEVEGITVAKGEEEAAKIGTKPMESQTKTISVYNLLHPKYNRELLLCDTPGLLDSQGTIVDIANQVGIVKSLQHANSIRVLLLIGHKNLVSVEGKGKLIKEVIDLYSKLIKDYSESQESVLIGFTHLNNDTTLQQINNSLKAMTDSVSDDEKVLQFLHIAIQNIEKKSNLFTLIKPLLSEKRMNLVDALFNIEEIPQDKVNQYFTYALAQNTKNEFELTLQSFQKDIQNLFQREEYEPITQRLKVLDQLNQQLEFPFVRKCFSESIQSVINIDLIKQTNSFLQRISQLQLDDFPFLLENIISVANYLTWTDQIKQDYEDINDSVISFNDFIDILSGALEEVYQSIEKSDNYKMMIQDFLKLYYIYYCDEIEQCFKANGKTLHNYHKGYIKIKNIYTNHYYNMACQLISNRVISLMEKMNSLTQSNEQVDVNDLEQNLTKLKDLYEFKVGDHLQLNTKKMYEEQIKNWSDFIISKKDHFNVDFQKYDLVLKNIELMKNAYVFLAQISSSQRLIEQHFPQFKVIMKDITQKLVNQAQGIFNKVQTQKKLSQMEKPIQAALEIMNISDDVRRQLQESSQAIFVYLGSIVQKFDMKFSSCVAQIKNCLLPKFESKDMQKGANQEDFQIIKKKINSIQKIFKKITMKYYQSFKFFQSADVKLKIAQEIFLEETMINTQDQVNEFRNPSGILNGLFTLKQCSFLLKDYSNKKFDEVAFKDMISLICGNINTKFSSVTKMVTQIQLPNTIDDSYKGFEEQIKNLVSLQAFIKDLSISIVAFDDKNQQTLENLIQLIVDSQNVFGQQLLQKLKQNLYDFENQKIPVEASRQKFILDQLQKLKEFTSIYSLIGADVYEHVLEKAISEQQRLIKEINDYLSDNNQLGDTFTQESAQKNLNLIRAAGFLYLTHFYGRLENPADNLQIELDMKQKGLDRKVKQMIKLSDYDQIIEYMQNLGDNAPFYKQIKKCLKNKVQMLYEEIVRSLIKRNILDDASLNKLKANFQNLEQAKIKLSKIQFSKFNVDQYFQQLTDQLSVFLNKQAKRFEEKVVIQKIEKANRCLMVVIRVVNNFSQYLKQEDLTLPDKMTNQMKFCFRQIEDSIDIKQKVQTGSMLSVLKTMAQQQKQYREEYKSILNKVNQLILDQALVFINTKAEQQKDSVSLNSICEQLKGEYQYLLVYTLDNYQEQYKHFFEPILNNVKGQMKEINELFVQRKTNQILNLINTSKSSIVHKEINNSFNMVCDSFFDLIKNKSYSSQGELLKFLSQIADGVRSYSYNSLKQKYFELQNWIEQEFIRLQTSTIESLNQMMFDKDSSGISEVVSFYQFNKLMSQFNFQQVKYEQFNLQSFQIFDKVQKMLKHSIQQLDSQTFNQTTKLIDFIYQTRVSLFDQQINLIDIYKSYLQDISQSQSHSSAYIELNTIINNGYWSLQSIKSGLVDTKIMEINNGINVHLLSKNYRETARILRQIEDFSKKIQESSIQMNTRDTMKLVFKKYEEKMIEAQSRKNQEKFDSKLFNLIEDLSEIEKYFKELIIQISNLNSSQTLIKEIERYIQNMSSQVIQQRFEDESDVREFVASLTNIRQVGFEIGQVHEFALEQISQIINIQFQKFTPQFISDVSSQLRKDKLGLLIIQENSKNFEGLLNKMIEELSKNQFSLEYVNNNIKGDRFSASEFSVQYGYYDDCWKNLLSQWHQGSLKAETILQKTKQLFKKFSSSHSSTYLNQKVITWNTTQKQDLAIMLAHLSTFWSIVNCQRREDSFRKLHPVQVSTVMRLLSIDTTTSQMPIENHLVQVKTGEGKSIILGITSSFLGLLGFFVDCCCYSSYLSQRDFQSFQHIFQQLEIDQAIKYNTFEKQFEDIINDPEDMRQVGLDLIENKLYKKQQNRQHSINQHSKKRILLIDEVDFFFGEDFIGRTYPVALYYNNQDVIDILKYIWQNRSMHIDKFKQTAVYKKLFANNPNLAPWQQFIDERIKMMYEDVNNLEGHRYLTYTPAGKSKTIICYKSLDGISFNTVKGYKTAFAYIQEWEKKNITEDVMNENLSFIINVGCFSFAQIPQEYQLVLGVSGTLEDMSEYQKNLTKNLFNIRKLTISPSIYGQSKFSFRKESDVIVKDNKFLFHLEISAQIEQVMKKNRSVIVFFENKRALDGFKNEFKTTFDWQVLIEETNFKGHTIIKAGSMNMITLATKPFGRGCDFISTDPELDINGGIHIIQTFLSEDLAEETQIKGRTARQAQCGSFSIIINREDLVLHFNMSASVKNFAYDFLHSLRQTAQKNKEKTLQVKLDETIQTHKESMRLKQILLAYSPSHNQEILDILIKFNRVTDRTENKTNLYNFYSDFAGKIGIYENGFEYDEYNNPLNVGLGSDGSFNDLSLLIGLFYPEEGMDEDIHSLLIPSLRKKGYKVCDVVLTEQDFIVRLPQYDQAWVISGYKFHSARMETRFQDAIEYHLKQQKGLMIWADNNPYIVHANLILQRISVGNYNRQPIHIKLDGSDYGDKVLKAGGYFETQQFGPHLITTGINNLHEGITICYPQVISNTPQDNFGHLNIIGLSSESKPCFFVLSGTEERGRIVFDCGFTKLMRDQWNTAGTVTYVTNCYAWLYWKERFIQNI